VKRLVDSWIEAERVIHGHNLASAIRRMNEKRGSSLTHSRVSEWRRGVFTPTPAVLSMMLFRALPWMLKEAGIDATPESYSRLEEFLWVCHDEGGTRSVELL
jgi:hypothetical protein